MKFHFASDLHLERGALDVTVPEGDVLLLAGDIVVAKCFDPEQQESSVLERRERFEQFFLDVGRKFDQTFLIGGNHEPYGCEFDQAHELLRTHVGDVEQYRTTYFDAGATMVGNVLLIFTPLWSDFEGQDPGCIEKVGRRLNDFKMIAKQCTDAEGKPGVRRFTPHDAIAEFQRATRFIRETLAAHPGQPTIVVTHHGPTRQMLNKFLAGHNLDGGFVSDLEQLILEHPQIKYWVCGHTHVRKSVEIGETTVIANCRGYVGRERLATNFTFQTIKV